VGEVFGFREDLLIKCPTMSKKRGTWEIVAWVQEAGKKRMELMPRWTVSCPRCRFILDIYNPAVKYPNPAIAKQVDFFACPSCQEKFRVDALGNVSVHFDYMQPRDLAVIEALRPHEGGLWNRLFSKWKSP
jgi:hypothetical protein